jgi:hypothetical protein
MALGVGEGSVSRPGHFSPPGKTWYPLYRRLGGPQSRSGQVQKIFPALGFDPQIVQPVASRYTDYATWPFRLMRSRSELTAWTYGHLRSWLSVMWKIFQKLAKFSTCIHSSTVSWHGSYGANHIHWVNWENMAIQIFVHKKINEYVSPKFSFSLTS